MSCTTPTLAADDPVLQTTSSPPFAHTSESLEYVATHVFLPIQPPDKDDYTPENNNALARAVCAAAYAYGTHVCGTPEEPQWRRIIRMLDNLQTSVQSQRLDNDYTTAQLRGMQTGDILAFHLQCQNAAIILTKGENYMTCEAFEVSPSRDAVERTAKHLKCSYPGSVAEVSNEVFHDRDFQWELAKFLSRRDILNSDLRHPPPSDPRYIKVLLDSISQSIGLVGDVVRMTERATLLKHIRDHVGWSLETGRAAEGVWRRSPLWLLIRVAIQTSVNHASWGASYKRFVLFFMCAIARDESNGKLSSDLLHLMSCQILQRLSKLGTSSPGWLSEMALKTSSSVREILDTRWKHLSVRGSPFRNPSQDELTRDTQVSLLDSREYICNALANPGSKPPVTPFCPGHHRRGTIYDFLSSDTFFDAAYDADPYGTLYDVKRSVEEGIDDWFACVSNVDRACVQLEILMDKYMIKAYETKITDPEDRSDMLLTGIELYVALDKLVVKDIPMLVDYPPEIPIVFLERLLLRKTKSLHRLSCAYQYLSVRHSQSHPGWSVLSDELTEDSFAVRYYNQSLHLQLLKARIEEDATTTVCGGTGLEDGGAGLSLTRDGYPEYQQRLPAERTEGIRSPLPSLELHGKAVVFELQCPTSFRIWRSAAPRILNNFNFFIFDEDSLHRRGECHIFARVPALEPYLVEHQGPLRWKIHLAYTYPIEFKSRNASPTLCHVVQYPKMFSKEDSLSIWRPNRHYTDKDISCNVRYYVGFSSQELEKYRYGSHSSNDVLAAQGGCPASLSLDEFVAFAHLRSAQSLQWLNILQGLRSRTLNLRHQDVYYLLAYASLEVGPLCLSTGTWMWHEELQDSSFCNALLDELDSLFTDVGAGSIDGVLMSSISLLVTRVLGSSPSDRISERAIGLLRRVRRKTFSWVLELSYNLAKAPTHPERSGLFQAMASTCRSTFNVDPAALRKLLHSAEDVDTILSCTLFILALGSDGNDFTFSYFQFPHDRSRRLSPLEDILGDVIVTDASDYGIDLAVSKIFPNYYPGTRRWERLQHSNIPWLSCNIEAAMGRPSQTLHINLRDGELRVNGGLLGGLPRGVRDSPEWHQIFRDQGFLVIPSSLPGMDFTTFTTTSKHKVHFSLRDGNLVLQAQCDQTNETFQLIPSRILQGDLPPALVDGHVHWLNLSTEIIEIRPRERLWEESSEHWRIDCRSGQYRVYKGHETLVDIRSPTWEMISKCFACLNDLDADKRSWTTTDDTYLERQRRDLMVTTLQIDSVQSASTAQLSVAVLHYGLSFFVNEREELESRDLEDMVYDENQSVGALFGLENMLVLRPKTYLAGVLIPEELIHRRVIIPTGHPTIQENHRVRIAGRQTSGEPLYHTYNVDTELGCLAGDGGLMSMGFLANLHVMTNFHRPDLLTGVTGAQAGLCLLRSAGCRSIMKPRIADRDHFYMSSKYPQIDAACRVILSRFEYDRYLHLDGRFTVPQWNTARRAAHLFPFNAVGRTSPEDHSHDEINYVFAEPGLPTLSLTVLSLRSIFNLGSPTQITLDNLLCNRPPPELPARCTLLCDSHNTKLESNDVPELDQLFSSLRTDVPFQREYLTRLDASVQHVRMRCRWTRAVVGDNLVEALMKHYERCRVNYLDSLDILMNSLGPTTDLREQVVDRFGQWPPITAHFLLRYLASTSPINASPRWKKCLTSLALLLLDLQRSRRLLRFVLDGCEEEVSKELENEGCDGWNAEEYPDWLLIQIQGNFLIRRTQAEAAMELISPQSGESTVMQVNMGEGKSSVIIPIAAAALADGKQLVRVIVPKALGVQMFELLVSRLSGLTNRTIYHLPFSRIPEYNPEVVTSPQIDELIKFMSQCMTEHGILVLHPEHVASLKLRAVEEQIREGKFMTDLSMKHQKSVYKYMKTLLSFRSLQGDSHVGNIFRSSRQSPNRSRDEGNTQTDHDRCDGDPRGPSDSAYNWLVLQKWLHSYARDILDENDQILHSRFQLVYTVGLQQHMDGYPERWTITQQVLKLVKKHIYSISRYVPDSVGYDRGPPGSFPHVRILRASDVGRRLTSLITEDVMSGRLPGFNFRHISSGLHNAIRSFISDEDVLQVPDTVKKVEEYAKGSNQSHLWSGLLLLRGLLTSNILLLALGERRWRVDYGLVSQPQFWRFNDPNATILSVPYRAKDVPLPNTQFGHPDLTIILTCLCYYYTGLTEWQLRTAFEILLDQDDPSVEYALWIEEYDRDSLPDSESLRNLNDINLRSSEQWDDVIYPLFARNRATIDFYLSRIVFPKEGKEFPWKLSASSWDLAEKREKLITGCSGTNDERWLLPISIAQRDLDDQKGTNAKVLAYLLQPENDFYMVAHKSGEQWITPAFLQMVAIQLPEIRVLLDVGSQILDLSNYSVATAWLGISRDTVGAVYFNEYDELMLVTRNGITQPAQSSPLFQQLDRCVVYLDHVHTRGTDIKLPIGSRAAVTLGPKVTKDAVVQGCMRMRKLGHGHSVMFFAPPDVDRSIRVAAAMTDSNPRITTVDILSWAIHETWSDIQRRAPHWAQQGMSHKSRSDAWIRFAGGELTQKKLADVWLEPELKSLTDLYAPCETKVTSSSLSALDPDIRQVCKDLGVLSLPKAEMEEEQEREVCREHEREREVELPPKAEPAQHFLHPDVVSFVRTGVIPPLHSGSAFQPVFTTLEKSSAATGEADVWSPFILATTDFCRTVNPESTRGTMDQYLRPVQWILSNKKTRDHDQVLVLLSPFEADRLMADIRASEYVHLHVYAPRRSQRMKPCDDLKLYSIPPLPSDWAPPWALIDQLNVFAGQLYLRDYQSYLRLCRFLGVPTKVSPNDSTGIMRRNLFNIPGSFEEMEITFGGSPLPSVMALLAMRSRGVPFAHTHMGKILQGQVLAEKDF